MSNPTPANRVPPAQGCSRMQHQRLGSSLGCPKGTPEVRLWGAMLVSAVTALAPSTAEAGDNLFPSLQVRAEPTPLFSFATWEKTAARSARLRSPLPRAVRADLAGCSPSVRSTDLVEGVLDGPFAAEPGQVVVVSNDACGVAMYQRATRVYWVSDTATIRIGDVGFGTAVQTPDLNGDGFDDLVLLTHGSRACTGYGGELVSLGGGSPAVLRSLGDVSVTTGEGCYEPSAASYTYADVLPSPDDRTRLLLRRWTCPSADRLDRCTLKSTEALLP